MARILEIVRGTTNTFNIAVTDADGNPYTLESGEVLVFGIKDKPYRDEAVVVKKVTSGTDGVYAVTLHVEDTINLKYGEWFYDVGIRSGNDYHSVIEPSLFKIKANATKWSDGA